MSPLLGSTGLVSYYSYRGNIDTLPDVFSIGADVTNAEINAEITRTTVAAITGINYKARVTPSSGATISVNGSAYTSTSQYVKNNQSISIKFTPTDYDNNYTVTLTVGKRSDSYAVGTRSRPADSIPNQFDFTNQTDIDPPGKTNIESNIVTLGDMSLPPAGARPEDFGTASISGNSAEFKVTRNGTVLRNYSTANFQVLQGDQIQLRMTAGGNSQTVSTTFSVTGTDNTNLLSPVTSTVSDTWSITSRTYTASITLSASPGTVGYNEASTISWTSQNIQLPITITNLGSFNNAIGNISTGNLNGGASGGTRTFTATANTLYSPPATVPSNTVTVTINPPPTPSVTLTADSYSVAYNGSTTLSWSSTNATSVNSSTNNFAGSNLIGINVSTGNLTQTTTYTIRVNGVEGQVSSPSSVTITVPEEPEIVKYITSNTTNADAQSYFEPTDWTRNVRKRLVINGGVVVGSTNHNLAGLIVTGGVVGAFVLENNGSIQGAGGAAGSANGGNGGKGGNAIRADAPGSGGTISVQNNGSIVAGGGGGGAGTKGGTGGQGGSGSYEYLASQSFPNAANCSLSYNQCASGNITACNVFNANCCGSINGCPNNQYATESTTGGDGGEGGNGGAGGVGQGYNVTNTGGVNTGLGSPTDWVGKTGGTNAGTGGQGGSGGSGGGGGGFGTNGDPGNQGDTGDPGTSGNVSGGTGGSTGSLPVGQGGASGYSLNGTNYTSLNGYVVGPTKSNP